MSMIAGRLHALLAGLVALPLVACQARSFQATLGSGAPRAAPTSGSPASASSSSEAHSPEYGPTGDIATDLVGCTVEEATRRAREIGYDGPIQIHGPPEFVAGCKPATVCGASPRLWQMMPGKVLTLYVNPKLTIKNPD